MESSRFSFGESGSDQLIARRLDPEPPEFDITAMVDLVFMMNIYFLVTFVSAALGEINLATANHCKALDGDTAITISILPRGVDPAPAEGDEGERYRPTHPHPGGDDATQ